MDSNKQSIVKLLAENGADVNIPNKEGLTPLHKAVTKRNIYIVQCLLGHGALANSQTYTGETPLHTAVKNKQYGIIRLLLESNANMCAEDGNNLSPLDLVNDSDDLELALIFGEKLSQQNG